MAPPLTDRVRDRVAIAAMVALLAVTGCASASHPAAAKAGGSSPSATAAPRLSVTSSIADGAHLDAAVSWSARLVSANAVTAVDFLVDGKVKWTEHNAPYYFNDDKNLLPPWLLGAGAHTLTVRATDSSGATASATSHITVAPVPKVPTALLATFRRDLTQADLKGTSSLPGYDPNNQPPTGEWTIRFENDYLIALGDPSNPVGENETFKATAAGDLTLAGPANWLTPPDLRGGLCEPAPLDHYHWIVTGNVLTISGGTNCPNRKALFDGKWTRR